MGTTTPVGPRFRVLGPLQVTAVDGTPVTLGGRRVRELLGVLLLHPHRTLSAGRLVDHLWGPEATDGASTTVRTYVGQLRRLLGQAGGAEALVTRDGGYMLVVDPADVDADRFERMLQSGQEALALGDVPGARDALSAALALWRGEVLADLDAPGFAAAATAHLEERRADAWEALMECELALGHHRDVVPTLQRLVAEHPFRERFTAQLVVALYRSGRQAEALAAYAATRARLADELGIDPGPELAALEAAVLRQDPLLGAAPGGAPPLAGPAGRGPVGAGAVGEGVPTAGPAPLPDAVLAALGRRPLVGREAAVDRLRACWAAVRSGGSGVVLVSGAAGIGKSRLAAELVRLASPDEPVVLVGRCEAGAAPYHPLVSALQPVVQPEGSAVHRRGGQRSLSLADVPEPLRTRLAPTADGDRPGHPPDDRPGDRPGDRSGDRSALWRSTTWLIGALAARRPLLLVVDDAERVDVATGALLRHVALHPPPRVLVLVCYRDPPGSRHAALAPLLGDPAVAQVAERVRVAALTETELELLAGRLVGDRPDPGWVRRLHRRTGGNPFYATELLRAAADTAPEGPEGVAPVPASVQDVLRQRLLALPEPTRELLEVAAVLSGEVELTALAGLAGRTDAQVAEALEPAVAGGFLVASGHSWAGAVTFPHELTREAVYGDIPAARRQGLHAAAARRLLAGPAVADADVVAAAVHLRRAGPAAERSEAARTSLEAARVTARALSWEEAVDHAEAAVDLLRRAAPTDQLWRALVEAALLRMRAGLDHGRAVALLEEALHTALATGDRAAAGSVHSRLGGALSLHHAVMDVPRALDHLAAAERMLPDPQRVFHLHRGRAQAAMYGLRTGLLDDASRHAQELAVALARPDLGVIGDWGMAWHAIDLGRVAEAERLLERGWETARDLGDAYLGWGPVNAAAILATLFRLDPAAGRAWCRRGMGQPRFGSFRQPHATVVDQLAHALLMSGEVEEARRVVDGLAADASSRRVLRLRDGDWEGASEDWSAALARDQQAGNLLDALVNARWLAEVLGLLGRRDRALEVMEEALAVATSGPQVPSELWFRAELARSCAVAAPGLAADHLRGCEVVLARGEDWGGLHGQVLAARAVVEAARGEWDRAERSYDEALGRLAEHRLPWHRAAAQRAWAELLDAVGRPVEAASARAAARATYDRIGAAARWRSAASPGGAP